MSKTPWEHEPKKKKEKPVTKKSKKVKSVCLDPAEEHPPSLIQEESSLEVTESVVEWDGVHIPSALAPVMAGSFSPSTGHIGTEFPSSPPTAHSSPTSGRAYDT